MATATKPTQPKKATKKKAAPDRFKEAAQNRKARFQYTIDDTLEAGIVLTGTEVKALRAGLANLTDSFAGDRMGDLVLMNAYIAEYQQASKQQQHETRRPRLLLVHKKQKEKWLGLVKRDGLTIVPLSIYFNARGIAKVKLGLAEGRGKADKRAAIKDREWKRDKARLMRTK